MLRQNPETKRFSADIKHRTFGRIHLALKTKVRNVAMTRHTALQQLLNSGEPVRDIVAALRAEKITIEAVAECVRAKQSFDVLRPSTWPTLKGAVNDLVEAQRARESGSERTAEGTETSLAYALEFFGEERPVESIHYEHTTEYKEFLREKGLSSNTMRTYMVKFGSVFSFLQRRETRLAMQQRRVPAVLFSPLDREDHVPAIVKTRVRFLVEQEVERILSASPRDMVLAPALGIFTGLRVGEVKMLREGIDVDLELGSIFIQTREWKHVKLGLKTWRPKYKIERVVPIPSALEPYLRAHLERKGDPQPGRYLFEGRDEGQPMGQSQLFSAIRRIVEDAGFKTGRNEAESISFHTFRHTFASWLVMSGADLFTVSRLMGHTSTKQVEETYAHLSPGHRLATVELLSAKWRNRLPSTSAGQATDTNRDTQDA